MLLVQIEWVAIGLGWNDVATMSLQCSTIIIRLQVQHEALFTDRQREQTEEYQDEFTK